MPDAVEIDTELNSEGETYVAGTDNYKFLRSTTVTANYGGDTHLTKVEVTVYYENKGVKNQVPATMVLLYTDSLE